MVWKEVDFVDVESSVVGGCNEAELLNPAARLDERFELCASGQAFDGGSQWNLNPRPMGRVEGVEKSTKRSCKCRLCGASRTRQEDSSDTGIDSVQEETALCRIESDDSGKREKRGESVDRGVHEVIKGKGTPPCEGNPFWKRANEPRLLHEFFETRGDGICPDLIAFRVQVEEVGHDFLGERAVGFEELSAEVEIVDFVAVVKLRDDCVHGLVFVTARIVRIACPAREDSEQKDFCLRRALVDGADDVANAGSHFFGRVFLSAAVVGSDHENDGLGFDSIKLAVFDAPENVLRAVSADSEVGWRVFPERGFPDCGLPSPTCGDGVAEEHELSFPFLGDGDERIMRFHESFLWSTGFWVHFRSGDVGFLDGQCDDRCGLRCGGCVLGEHIACDEQCDEG